MKDLNLIFEGWREFIDKGVITEGISERYLDSLKNGVTDFENLVRRKSSKNSDLLLGILQNLHEEFKTLRSSKETDNEKYQKTVDNLLDDRMKEIDPEEMDEIIRFLEEKIKSLSVSNSKEKKSK